MSKGRLEAFTDGVLAVVITIMVLELGVPPGADLSALLPLTPVFLSYILSFIFLGIYWNNHHHLLQAARQINGRDSLLATALGRDTKAIVSLTLYTTAIPIAFWAAWLSCLMYVIVAILWLIPDRRIEKILVQ
jgi:uncharacterized membrane protein